MDVLNARIRVAFQLPVPLPQQIFNSSKILLVESCIFLKLTPSTASEKQIYYTFHKIDNVFARTHLTKLLKFSCAS